MLISPSNKDLFNKSKNLSFSCLFDLLKIVSISGNTLSTSFVIVFTISFAASVSLAFKPCLVISAANTSSGKSPLGLNGAPTYLLIHLSNALSLYANSFPLCANALAPLPTPAITGVTNNDSEPNLTLFNNLLDASSLP